MTGLEKDLEYMVKNSLDVDAVDQKTGLTPLHYAAANGNENCTEILINAGAKINTQDKDGETPIMSALLGGKAMPGNARKNEYWNSKTISDLKCLFDLTRS